QAGAKFQDDIVRLEGVTNYPGFGLLVFSGLQDLQHPSAQSGSPIEPHALDLDDRITPCPPSQSPTAEPGVQSVAAAPAGDIGCLLPTGIQPGRQGSSHAQ